MENFVRLAEKFQDEGLFLVWGPTPSLFIFSEEAFKIFSNEKSCINKTYHLDMAKEVAGNGLLTSNSETWKKERKMLNPVFQVEALKKNLSIFNENAEYLVKQLQGRTNEAFVDILEYTKTCVFGIVCEYTMGLKINNPQNREEIAEMLELVNTLLASWVYRISHPWLLSQFIMSLVPYGKKSMQMRDRCRGFVRKIILETEKSSNFRKYSDRKGEIDSDQDSRSTNSFAEILLKHRKENPNFTMENIQDHVATILATGYDTVSYGLLWSLFLLGHHPDVQEQAFEEIHSASEGFIEYEDLHKLRYLDCIIKESLRLFSPAPIFARCTAKDIQCGKYNVPQGTDLVFFPYMLHRNPEIYPDPEKFDPDRFLDGKIENRPWAYCPFAEGIRNCIGKRFALLEMKVILTYILRHFQITSMTPREEVEPSWIIALVPSKPLLFKLTPRK